MSSFEVTPFAVGEVSARLGGIAGTCTSCMAG